MLANFNQPIIGNYSPIYSKGGRRHSKAGRALGSRKHRTRKHKRSNKSRTRRHY
jgi:hypothetical protein